MPAGAQPLAEREQRAQPGAGKQTDQDRGQRHGLEHSGSAPRPVAILRARPCRTSPCHRVARLVASPSSPWSRCCSLPAATRDHWSSRERKCRRRRRRRCRRMPRRRPRPRRRFRRRMRTVTEAPIRVGVRFSKMHGLGNDFVIVDCRAQPLALDAAAIRAAGRSPFRRRLRPVADHRAGPRPLLRLCATAIWNTDGTRAGQCGNGLRCVARWLERAGALAPGRRTWKARPGRSRSSCLAMARCARDGRAAFRPGADSAAGR